MLFFGGVIHQIFASMTTLRSCKIPVNIVFPCYSSAETIKVLLMLLGIVHKAPSNELLCKGGSNGLLLMFCCASACCREFG